VPRQAGPALLEIVWADDEVERSTVSVFGSADIGRTLRVGDLGYDDGSRKLARADVAPRPWLEWIGIGVAIIAFLPTLVGCCCCARCCGSGRSSRHFSRQGPVQES